MFRPTSNFNQYYGLNNNFFSPRHNSKKKLKRTELSGQKLSYSKRSESSQNSLGKSQRNRKIFYQLRQKNPLSLQKNGNKIIHKQLQSPAKAIHIKTQNILDAFKIKVCQTKEIKKLQDLNYKKKYQKYIEGTDFERCPPIQQSNNNFSNTKRSKSSRQSPLKKILRSKKKFDAQSPFKRMVQNVKNSKKQAWNQQQKTIKHIKIYTKTKSQINQTNLDNNHFINNYKTFKEENKQYQNFDLNKQKKGQYYSNKKLQDQPKLYKIKSQKQIVNKQKIPISSSKIKNYFAKKKQSQKKTNLMKEIFNQRNQQQKNYNISKNSFKDNKMKEILSSNKISKYPPQLKQSQCSSVSNSQYNHLQQQEKKLKHQTDDYEIQDFSVYGLQSSGMSSRNMVSQKNFQEKYKKDHPISPAGQIINSIKSFQQVDKQFLKESGNYQNASSSMVSIESNENFQKQVNLDQRIGKNMWKSEQYIINLKSSNKQFLSRNDLRSNLKKDSSEIKQESSINVASNHNKKKKITIISQLQKDILAEQSRLKKSKLRQGKELKKQSKISQTSDLQNKSNLLSNFLMVQKQPYNQLSDIIHNSSPSIDQKQKGQQIVNKQIQSSLQKKNLLKEIQEQVISIVNQQTDNNKKIKQNNKSLISKNISQDSVIKISVDSNSKSNQFLHKSQKLEESLFTKTISDKYQNSDQCSDSSPILLSVKNKQLSVSQKQISVNNDKYSKESQRNSPLTHSSRESISSQSDMNEINQNQLYSQSSNQQIGVQAFKKVKILPNKVQSNFNYKSSSQDINNQQKSLNKLQNDSIQLDKGSNILSSFKNLSLSSRNNITMSEKRYQIKTFQKKNIADFTLNDVLYRIQQHQLRIGSFALYVDNTKAIYQDQQYLIIKYQLLNFLMMKKYLFQQLRVIQSLKGNKNIFVFSQIEIPNQVLKEHKDRQQVSQRLQMLKQANISIKKQFQDMYQILLPKYEKEKLFFNTNYQQDNFSKEIIRRLMEELMTLYQKWQNIETDKQQKTKYMLEERMTEIIEIIFLISQLDNKPVKACQLFSQQQMDFASFYETYYQKIIETFEYFQNKK